MIQYYNISQKRHIRYVTSRHFKKIKIIHLFRIDTITILHFLPTQLTTQSFSYYWHIRIKQKVMIWQAVGRDAKPAPQIRFATSAPARRRPLTGSSFSAQSSQCRLPLTRTWKLNQRQYSVFQFFQFPFLQFKDQSLPSYLPHEFSFITIPLWTPTI